MRTDDARKYIHLLAGCGHSLSINFLMNFIVPISFPEYFQNRGGDTESKSIQGKLKSSATPTVKIAVVPSSAGKAEVYVRLTDNGSGAVNLRLFHNGKSVLLDHVFTEVSLSKGPGDDL